MNRYLESVLLGLIAVPAFVACDLDTSTGSSTRAAPTEPPRVVRSSPAPRATEASTAPRQAQVPTAVADEGVVRNSAPLDTAGLPVAQAGEMTVPKVVDSVSDAVVEIIAESQQGGGTGSGFIIDKNANIITNNHVIEGARRITVILPGNKVARAQLVGRDPLTDIAVLRLQEKNLPTVPLGDAEKLEVGETVVAIGSALGLAGGPTVTTGVVSALNRAEDEPGSAPNVRGPRLYDLIQTDTAINPGNSGGPLLNLRGEVVGVNTLGQRATGAGVPVQGINFAVSINTARSVAQEIIEKGEVVYPYIGISGEFLYPQVAVTRGLPNIRGQLVVEVQPGTPAAEANLRQGDIITEINGKRIEDESTFNRLLRANDPGDTIRLGINRNGQEREVEITLAERPAQP